MYVRQMAPVCTLLCALLAFADRGLAAEKRATVGLADFSRVPNLSPKVNLCLQPEECPYIFDCAALANQVCSNDTRVPSSRVGVVDHAGPRAASLRQLDDVGSALRSSGTAQEVVQRLFGSEAEVLNCFLPQLASGT